MIRSLLFPLPGFSFTSLGWLQLQHMYSHLINRFPFLKKSTLDTKATSRILTYTRYRSVPSLKIQVSHHQYAGTCTYVSQGRLTEPI